MFNVNCLTFGALEFYIVSQVSNGHLIYYKVLSIVCFQTDFHTLQLDISHLKKYSLWERLSDSIFENHSVIFLWFAADYIDEINKQLKVVPPKQECKCNLTILLGFVFLMLYFILGFKSMAVELFGNEKIYWSAVVPPKSGWKLGQWTRIPQVCFWGSQCVWNLFQYPSVQAHQKLILCLYPPHPKMILANCRKIRTIYTHLYLS